MNHSSGKPTSQALTRTCDRFIVTFEPMGLFNSFSQRARRAVFWANSRALQEDASEITAEHILYGVLQEDPELFALLVPENPKLASQIEESLVANGEVSKPRART